VIELFLAGIRILPHDRSNTEAMLLRVRPAFTDLRKRSQTSAATHLIARKANAGAATKKNSAASASTMENARSCRGSAICEAAEHGRQ
jgi:hypothetical protein